MIYGSEIALLKLAAEFTKYYKVHIFGPNISNTVTKNDIKFQNSRDLHQFQKQNTIDVMIISRYIHYFIEFTNTAKQTYIWMHDMLIHSAWNFKLMTSDAKHLLENTIDNIDGLIALSPWHKEYILKYYDVDPDKILIIGNAIDPTLFSKPVEKVPNRFIYTSAPNRGLDRLIEYF